MFSFHMMLSEEQEAGFWKTQHGDGIKLLYVEQRRENAFAPLTICVPDQLSVSTLTFDALGYYWRKTYSLKHQTVSSYLRLTLNLIYFIKAISHLTSYKIQAQPAMYITDITLKALISLQLHVQSHWAAVGQRNMARCNVHCKK